MDKNFSNEFSVFDPEFFEYANKRMEKVINSGKHAYNYKDEVYDDISENLVQDEKYLAVYIPYLTYKFNEALLIKKRWKRENEIWWIWKKLISDFTLIPFSLFLKTDSFPQQVIGAVTDILTRDYLKEQGLIK